MGRDATVDDFQNKLKTWHPWSSLFPIWCSSKALCVRWGALRHSGPCDTVAVAAETSGHLHAETALQSGMKNGFSWPTERSGVHRSKVLFHIVPYSIFFSIVQLSREKLWVGDRGKTQTIFLELLCCLFVVRINLSKFNGLGYRGQGKSK